MYPDLSYFFADLFGTPADNALSIVKTFGFMLVLAFLASAYVLRLEMKRKTEEGLFQAQKLTVKSNQVPWSEWVSNGLILFVLGWKLPYIFSHFDEMKIDPASVLLSSKGVAWVGLLLLAAYALLIWINQQRRADKSTTTVRIIQPVDRVPDITMMAALFGIIGARVFVIFESRHAFESFLRSPIESLLSGSGLAIYGGLIIAFIGVYWYVKRLGFKPIHIMDAVAPALVIGYAVGRIGCQLSGDGDWGIPHLASVPSWWFLPDWLWAYDYPNTVLQHVSPDTHNSLVEIPDCSGYVNAQGGRPIYCAKLEKPVYPTPVYETIVSMGIFAFLWMIRKRIKIAGMLFFIYCILTSVHRFFIEKIRVNDIIDLGFARASQAEIISVLLFLVGVGGCLYLWRQHQRTTISD